MSTTFTVPDFWVFYDAAGKAIASSLGTFRDGSIANATADDAWRSAFDTKKGIASAKAAGVRAVPVESADWEDFWHGRRLPAEIAEALA
ncbi:MAG: hypothetical protein J0J04_08050 [Microbacterium sp.]|uniref:hypothetical protein n=1 Tax=Microbacterium sp. TaxID=51671 RepID=UPI001AD4E17C|nr:hypothetical protein [Microbacterium sp.]MBN9214752.1 hypothetical protein [Microbacterium sp.]